MKIDSYNKIEITFLGTGSSLGIPILGLDHPVCKSTDTKDKRLRSSLLIQYNHKNYLIDCGPDFRQQMLKNNISDLEAILLTHEHNDHISGLDDVRPFCFLTKKALPIYAEKRVINTIKNRYTYCFDEKKYPGSPDFEMTPISVQPFNCNELPVAPIRVHHGSLPILGFRIGSFAYLTDVNAIQPDSLALLRNLEVLVLSSLRKENKHHSQYILPESLEVINFLQPKKAYLTHIGVDMGLHEETEKSLPENVFLAYDGLQIII